VINLKTIITNQALTPYTFSFQGGKRLWEDLRHGLFLGSKSFVERIRKEFLPAALEPAIAQQARLAKQYDPILILHQAERILKCDVNHFLQTGKKRDVVD